MKTKFTSVLLAILILLSPCLNTQNTYKDFFATQKADAIGFSLFFRMVQSLEYWIVKQAGIHASKFSPVFFSILFSRSFCYLGFSPLMEKMDGIVVRLGADIIKNIPHPYAQAVSEFLESNLSIEVVFFPQQDGRILYQIYLVHSDRFNIIPKGRKTAGDSKMAKIGANFSMGWTWGCDADPKKYAGYHMGANLAGFEVNYGFSDSAFFEKLIADNHWFGTDNKRRNFDDIVSDHYNLGNTLIRKSVGYVDGLKKGSKPLRGDYQFTLAEFEELVRKAESDDGVLTVISRTSHNFSPIENWSEFFARALEEPARLADLHLQKSFLRDIHEFYRIIAASPEVLDKNFIHETSGRLVTSIREEQQEMLPILDRFVFRRVNTDLVSGKRVDLIETFLSKMPNRKKFEPWLRDLIRGYEYRNLGLTQMSHLLQNWAAQARMNQKLNLKQTIGGSDLGQKSPWTRCNSLSMTAEGWNNWGIVNTAYIKMFYKPHQVVKQGWQSIKSGFTLFKDLFIKSKDVVGQGTSVGNARKMLLASIPTVSVNMSYAYQNVFNLNLGGEITHELTNEISSMVLGVLKNSASVLCTEADRKRFDAWFDQLDK